MPARILLFACSVALFVLLFARGLYIADNPADALVMVVAHGLAVAVTGLALYRPPLREWHAGLALAGFVVAAVRTRLWSQLATIGDHALAAQLAIALLAVALVAAAVTLGRLVTSPRTP